MRKMKVLVILYFIFSLFLSLGAAEPDLTSRLAGLAKVWGFLKYYHPEVATGASVIKQRIDWDAELLAIIPDVKAAGDFHGYNAAIDRLIDRAGVVRIINMDRADTAEQSLGANFSWLENEDLFDWYNRLRLKMLKFANFPRDDNYYVQSQAGVGNTLYTNEKKYDSPAFPDEGHRLLALFRYWNIIHYFYPYKEVIGSDWQGLLDEFIPRLIAASDELDFNLLVREFTARINDSHAFCLSNKLTDFFGLYYPPFEVRCIEDQTVVTRVFADLPGVAGTVMVGDVITKLNNVDISQRRQELRPYVGASNEMAAEKNIHDILFKGKNEPFTITLLRDTLELNVTVERFSYQTIQNEKNKMQPEKWTLLPDNIGYVHMGVLQGEDVDGMMNALRETKAIIFDIRNYPNWTIYEIQQHLNPTRCPFVKFTVPDLKNPGSFNWTTTYFTGPETPNPDYYKGQVVVLHDERTLSQAEFTCMSLQTAPRATLLGSQTAGADGNVSNVYLPGNILANFTGIGVFYPDGRPTQRIGIVPDIEVRPTAAGIRQGRDEVVEAAIAFINK
jgi:carboxyl-terminal processing protease